MQKNDKLGHIYWQHLFINLNFSNDFLLYLTSPDSQSDSNSHSGSDSVIYIFAIMNFLLFALMNHCIWLSALRVPHISRTKDVK